jgi:hypothetical protein
MADEATNKKAGSIVGDATKGVQDTWNFFFPRTIRFAICLGIVIYLGGWPRLAGLIEGLLKRMSAIDAHAVATNLDQYKLTHLVPIIAFFVLATLAYSWNQLVFVTALLIPFSISYTIDNFILKCGRAAEMLCTFPEIDWIDMLGTAIDLEIEKA